MRFHALHIDCAVASSTLLIAGMFAASAAVGAADQESPVPGSRQEAQAADLQGRVKSLESWRGVMQDATALLETRYDGLNRLQKEIRTTVLAMREEQSGLVSEWTALQSRDQEVSIRVADVVAQVQILAQAQQKTDAAVSRVDKQSADRSGVVQLMNQVDGLNIELSKLRGQIEVLTNNIENAQKRQRDMYVDLDTRLRRIEQQGSASKKDQETIASLEERIRKLEQSAAGLAAIPSPVASAAAASPAALSSATSPAASASPNPASAAPAAAQSAVSVVSPAAAAAAPPTSLPPATLSGTDQAAIQRAYENAISNFRINDYQGAIRGFESLLKANPKHQLAPNAQYWIGESYFHLHDYRAAIEAQRKLLGTYPESPKTADALLIIGTAESNLGDSAAARKTFEDLIAKYPASESAEKAKGRLARLK